MESAARSWSRRERRCGKICDGLIELNCRERVCDDKANMGGHRAPASVATTCHSAGGQRWIKLAAKCSILHYFAACVRSRKIERKLPFPRLQCFLARNNPDVSKAFPESVLTAMEALRLFYHTGYLKCCPQRGLFLARLQLKRGATLR